MALFKKKEVARTEIFENMPPVKAILTLAIPTILNQLVNIIYNLADTFYIGKLNNPSMVAALSVSSVMMIMLTSCCSLMIVGGCAVIAKALGNKNMKRAEDVAIHCPLIAFVFGSFVSLVMIIFINPITWYAGATESCFEYTKTYLLWVVGYNAVPQIFGMTMGAVLRGRGYSKYEMLGLTCGNILNIILDPLFIFTFGIGFEGAAIATFISSCVSMTIFLVLANRMQKKEHIFTPYKEFKFQWDIVKDVVSTGFPAWFHQFFSSIVNTRFMNLLKVYSDAAIAAAGIGRKIEHVAGQIVIGLYQGSIPHISYNHGNRNFERMNTIRKTSLKIGITFGIIALLVIAPFSKQFTQAFIMDEATVAFGIIFVRIYSSFPLLMAINNNCRTVFQALGEKKKSTRISLIRNVVLFLPVMYLMNHFFGVVGLILSNEVTDAIIDIYSLISMRKTMNRLKTEMNA